ncbi:hypothetical protein XH94_06750 [Bradyrhizobium zhanjiangense]|uniref:Uncharacterized protein n=1 Tax=Bradyrhizobium zhanjiangense TaxID=1325107 RepID=A0A4Q0SQG7_9BRAD|nr:hypothetical protein XH94_06750 [Bradyrhizobium zhanjiangense]
MVSYQLMLVIISVMVHRSIKCTVLDQAWRLLVFQQAVVLATSQLRHFIGGICATQATMLKRTLIKLVICACPVIFTAIDQAGAVATENGITTGAAGQDEPGRVCK